jgi:hypothetical protein
VVTSVVSKIWNSEFLVLRRVSKLVTNISNTTVMDVISFLCVSLGSSIVHLHYSLASRRAYACSEAGFIVKIAAVLDGCTTEEQNSVVRFL